MMSVSLYPDAQSVCVRSPVPTTASCLSCKLRFQNDLYCVGWGVKLYSLTHSHANWL